MTKLKITKSEFKYLDEFYKTEIYRKRKIDCSVEHFKRDLRTQNIIKSFGMHISTDRKGAWNGYGYTRLPNCYHAQKADQPKWSVMMKKLKGLATKKEPVYIDPETVWVNRLVKLTGISLEEAKEIAEEKLEYKQQQIDELNERQVERYSVQRSKLINYIERSNPLRCIVDVQHAHNILRSSHRHKYTKYERALEDARALANIGELNYNEIKDYAHKNK